MLTDRGLFATVQTDRAMLAFATISVTGMLLVTLRMARVARVALRATRDIRRAGSRLAADDPVLAMTQAEELVMVQRHRIDETATQRGERDEPGQRGP